MAEIHTDFVFALVGEELGFVGCAAVILAFMAIAWYGSRLAWFARVVGPFAYYLAAGAVFIIVFQAVINLAVVTEHGADEGHSAPLRQQGRQQPPRLEHRRRVPPRRGAADARGRPGGAVGRLSAAGGVLFVGGGTVGHLAPAFALADALRRRGIAVVIATPGESGEAAWFPPSEPPPLRSTASRLPRRAIEIPLFPPRLALHVARAWRLLGRLRPGVVVGLGGWPCVPAALAARLRRIPLVLIASDAHPGAAVRRLAGLATRVYVAQEAAAQGLPAGTDVLVTGPIVRDDIARARAAPEAFGLQAGRLTLFVTGGSLGARALNERLAAGLEEAVRRDPGLARRIQVLHSVGRSEAGVRATYERLGLCHHVTPFIRDMGAAYATADLVVCRAGAQTCHELRAAARPALLVPYPHHADRQQYENARLLVECGGAVLVEEADLDADGVRRHVLALLEDRDARRRMAEAMRGAGGAASPSIVDDLVRFLGRGTEVSEAS